MSPLQELARAAAKILSDTDAEIAQIERWLSGEEDEATVSGLTAELERLQEERRIVAAVTDSLAQHATF